MNTLYQKYGSELIVNAVRSFYENLEKSPLIKPYFAGIDKEKLIEFQIEYFKKLFGGPEADLSKYATYPHRLPIPDDLFMDVAEILENTLIDAKLDNEDIENILSLIAQSRINQ